MVLGSMPLGTGTMHSVGIGLSGGKLKMFVERDWDLISLSPCCCSQLTEDDGWDTCVDKLVCVEAEMGLHVDLEVVEDK